MLNSRDTSQLRTLNMFLSNANIAKKSTHPGISLNTINLYELKGSGNHHSVEFCYWGKNTVSHQTPIDISKSVE